LRLAVTDQPDVLLREGAADGSPDGFEEHRAVLAGQKSGQFGFVADDQPQAAIREV
jgi:hypothetical protein